MISMGIVVPQRLGSFVLEEAVEDSAVSDGAVEDGASSGLQDSPLTE